MNRFHTAVIALLLAVAGVAGTFAAVRTTSHTSNSTAIAARTKQLDAFEAKLHARLRAAERRPAAAPQPAAPPEQVIVRRAAPIIVTTHSRHGEDEHESGEGNEGGDD